MSHAQQLTRDELEHRLAELENTIEDVQAGLQNDRRERARDRQRIATLEDTVETLTETVDSLETELDRVNRERAALARRLTAVEADLDIEPGSLGEDVPLPLDLLAKIGPEAVDSQPGATLERAAVIARNRLDWGETRHNIKYDQHHVLASRKHGVRDLLAAARDEDLEWIQVHRAMEKCADLGGDAVVLVEYDDWGKSLVDRRGEQT